MKRMKENNLKNENNYSCCQTVTSALWLAPWLFTLNIYLMWHRCHPSAAIAVLLTDFASFFGSCCCWFMSPSPGAICPADKIKFHTSVQCQLPLPGVLILTPILIAYDDNDVPHADTSVVSCNELHPKWMIIKLFCWRLKPHNQFKDNHPKRSLH